MTRFISTQCDMQQLVARHGVERMMREWPTTYERI